MGAMGRIVGTSAQWRAAFGLLFKATISHGNPGFP